MIKAVLFDLFETLITETSTNPTRASHLAGALGLENDAFRVEWRARRPRVVLGRLSFGEALTEISRTLIGRVDTAAVEQVREQRIREKAMVFAVIDERISALIGQLRGQGISLAVISNGFAEDVRPWPTWPLAREFQCCVFSCVAGVAKPDPEIYLKAIYELGVEPDAAVFIGDGGDDELAGAQRAGLRALRADWFSTRERQAASSDSDSVGLATPADVMSIVAEAGVT